MPDPELERSLERPKANAENVQDIIPPTERSQDPSLNQVMHDLSAEAVRPLTDAERKAADRDAPTGERVYAPASERVPVQPVPGHRNFTDHPDTHTPEREAAGAESTGSTEPSFTRVARPSTASNGDARSSDAN